MKRLRVAAAVPSIISHSIAPADGDLPPVSGASGVGSGVGAGIAAGAPCLPTATDAGSSLIFPHTCVPVVTIRTDDDSTVSEPSAFVARIATSLMFSLSSPGSGTHTFAAAFNRYDDTVSPSESTTEIPYKLPPGG